MFNDTLNSLKTNTFIITPNRRLASFLTKQIIARLGENEVLDLKICSWQDALLLFRQQQPLSFSQGLLSPWQARFVWQGVMRQSAATDGLINLSDTQKLAASAADLCVNWLVDPNALQGQKEESDSFIAWWKSYLARCETLQCVDETLLAKTLLTAAQSGALRYDRIVLYGFDELTPLQKAVTEAFKVAGCELIFESGHQFQCQPVLCEAAHAAEEWLAAIQHAKSILDHNPHPELPIGIVIPDIQRHWSEISALLTKVFHPEQGIPGSAQQNLPYNISSGMALSDHPAVGCALIILNIYLNARISAENLSYLLQSPFIQGGIAEQSKRALFDTSIRVNQAMDHSVEQLVSHAQMPILFQGCLALSQIDTQMRQSFTAWVDEILALLQAWGWPGQRTLDSITYQAVEQFYEVLTELRTLDAVTHEVNYETVLHQAVSQLKHTLFQPQTEDKPLQVLGLLEAAGMSFSHLWVCGMDDTIPASPKPNPFIPTQVQRALDMPHASAAREWDFAHKMIERLSQSSPHVIFSYHENSPEGYQVHPSYFVKSLPRADLYVHPAASSVEQRMLQETVLEDMPDSGGLPLETDQAQGGSFLFKAQIACPFSAYAMFRLKARSPDYASLGLSMKSRGHLLHAIMHGLMSTIQNSDILQNMSEQEEDALINQTIEQALSHVTPPLNAAQYKIESKRVYHISKAALQIERERGEFTVKALEMPMEVKLAGLKLNVRIDRLDDTPEGELLIDYKTGKVDKKSWDPESPDDPQLPLYAIASSSQAAGIAFSILRKEEIGHIGEGVINMPGITTLTEEDWSQNIEIWRGTLTSLAKAYQAGHATIAPKYGHYTCEHCALALCCRVNEMELPYE